MSKNKPQEYRWHLRKWRVSNDLFYDDMGLLLGVPRMTYWTWETGVSKTINPRIMKKLERLTGLSPEEINTFSKEPISAHKKRADRIRARRK